MITVIDTETTGTDAAVDSVVEFAAVPLQLDGHEWTVGQGHSSLVAPGRSIPPQARAVHHLSDAELREAPQLREAIAKTLEASGATIPVRMHYRGFNDDRTVECAPWLIPGVIAAHNMEFDWGFIGQFFAGCQIKTLCTWRCAMHAWPDAPGYGNQVLRYYIPNLDPEVRAALPPDLTPHRALYDAITTAFILRALLARFTLEALLSLQEQPVLQKTVRFGKHRGVLWSDVPLDYCRWIIRQDNPPFDRDVVHTARYYLSAR